MSELLHLSLNGTVFIAAICLLRLGLKRFLPRTAFCVLWLTAALRLLCPVRLPSALSFWRLASRTTAQPAPPAAVLVRQTLYHSAELPVRAALPNVCEFLTKLWAFGTVLLLTGIAVLYFAGLRQAQTAQPLENGAYLCHGLPSPRLCGIVRPRILLPDGVGEELLPYILLHERVHQKRLDNLWKLLALTAAAVHWFNPAAWLLVVLLGRDLEVACDEWVLHGLDSEQRRHYALSLIELAGRPADASPLMCGFTRNPLEERIRFIMTNRKKSAFALSVATAMILCTTSAFATDAPLDVETAPRNAVDADVNFSDSLADAIKMGTYEVHFASDGGLVADNTAVYTVTKNCDNSELDFVAGFSVDDLEFFTAEEYAAYLEEQKMALLDEITAGNLSQATYDMTIRDMEKVLEGIRAGTTVASKPFTAADGSEVEYALTTFDSNEYTISYGLDENGTMTVSVDDKEPILLVPVSEK